MNFYNSAIYVCAIIGSGSPISLIKSCRVEEKDKESFDDKFHITGINGSSLNIQSVVL